MRDDSEDSSPRRFLIAGAVSRHRLSPDGDRPGLVHARQTIVDLFVGRLGYALVAGLDIDPERDDLLRVLDAFACDRDRRADDVVVVYLAGHGDMSDDAPRRHVFFTAEADLAKPKLALPTSQIASVLTANTGITRLLFMLDTCHAGQGGADTMKECLAGVRRDIDDTSSGVVVAVSAQPAQQARVAAFPDLLMAAFLGLSESGRPWPGPTLGALVAHMNASADRPPTQRFEWAAGKLTGDVPAFFAEAGASARTAPLPYGEPGAGTRPTVRVTRTMSRDGSRTEELEIFDQALAREVISSFLSSPAGRDSDHG